MKEKILITDPVHSSLIEKLKKRGYLVNYKIGIKKRELIKIINKFNILIIRSGIKINKEVLIKAKNLKVIARAGVGLDNIDLNFAKQRKIKVFNVANISLRSVAEFTIGLLISSARKITLSDKQLRNNIWKKNELYGIELKGKTLGIVGAGKIGEEVAKIADSLSLNVCAYIKNRKKLRSKFFRKKIKIVSLDKLLKNSDFVTVHTPLTYETKNMISNKEINLMKRKSILINMSRGGVVNENALYNNLKKNRIFGAATDVYLFEKQKNKLFKLDNITATSHIGAMTFECQKKIGDLVFKKLEAKL